MSFVADHISGLSPSLTLAITAQAAAMKREGQDIISFGAGEPDFDTPEHIKVAAAQALAEGKTKYTDSSGIKELRTAISDKLKTENDLVYSADEISVNCGAKHSCYNAILATVNPGDEVIIPAPFWTSYPEMVRMCGGVPVIVETSKGNGWKMTLAEFEAAMTPRTKMVILNSPGNPTGAVYSKKELEDIAALAVDEEILILSDEIYEKLVYGKSKHVSIGSLSQEIRDITITVNGFSKAYAMTGWRLGYTAAPKEIADAIATIQSHSTSNPTSFAQYGGLAALTGDQQIVEDMRDEFDMRRQYMLQRLKQISNVGVVEPHGAFYFLVDISKTSLTSVNFSEKLLSRQKVAVVPGVAFGAEGTVRFSYATSLDIIHEGLERFATFCASH